MKKKLISILLVIILCLLYTNVWNISKAESVKTMKIVIDPGHGGYETGAVNYDDGIIEME